MESSLSKGEQELLSDCTCPICKEVFVNPQQLPCRHTICRKCITKMAQKAEESPDLSEMINPFDMLGLFGGAPNRSKGAGNSSTGKKSLRCPICRETCEQFEPDEATESMVKVLRLLRDSRCRHGPDECWAEATVLCPCCDKHYCQKHYEAQMVALQTAGETLCQGIRSLLSRDGPEEKEEMLKLQNTLGAAQEVEKTLTDTLQKSLAAFYQQVLECLAQLQTPTVKEAEIRSVLERDLDNMAMLLKRSDFVGLARLLPQAKERLKAAQRDHPPRVLALQFDPNQLKEDLAALMTQISASTYQSPYKELPKVLDRIQARGLSQKPWDIGILSNLDGVMCSDGVLKLVTGASSTSLSGPLLVINVQHFPTKMLHVTDLDVKQVATIKPQFGQEGMPGRMHVYNERQLILTSDAGRHKVSVFNLEGKLQISFGQKGDAPRYFHTPLGMSASNGHMFVVDSKNKRIQLFDMDNGYDCLAIILHDKFSNGIHSIATNLNSIFVVDRDESNLFVFDRETRLPVGSKFSLGGQPFDIQPDEFGNAFVTLIEDGKIQIVHRLGVLKTISFKETHENQPQRPEALMFALMPMLQGGTPPRMFHGVAYEHTKRRLYIADLMRSCIIAADLSHY